MNSGVKLFVFLLGRPGCGKSEVWRNLIKRLEEEGIAKTFKRIDDFPILNLWKEEDFKNNDYSHFRPTDDGGFKVIDDNVWDELLKRLNEKIQHKSADVLAVEFARPNYVHSLSNFSMEVLSRSVIVYIDAPFETCWKRNMERVKRMKEQGLDAHFVSKKEMEETYLKDDKDELLKRFSEKIVLINNNEDVSLDELKREVEKIVLKLRDTLV